MNIELAKLLERICNETSNLDCSVRDEYSGRGMYGESTAGIVVDSVPMLLADVLQWVSDNITTSVVNDEVVWLGGEIPDISNFRIDNMGRATILY